jgi:hypothetical protein
MGKLNIKNGTPVGSAHLCKSCSWGQIMTGHRESDLLVVCTNLSPNIVVPFTMRECTEFSDKFKPTWEQMKQLAIEVAPSRVSAKTRGFAVAKPLRPAASGDEDTNEDEDEAATAL